MSPRPVTTQYYPVKDTTGAQFGPTPLLEGPAGRLPLTEPQEVQHLLPTRVQKGTITEPRDAVPLGPHQPGNCGWRPDFNTQISGQAPWEQGSPLCGQEMSHSG